MKETKKYSETKRDTNTKQGPMCVGWAQRKNPQPSRTNLVMNEQETSHYH